MTSPDSFPLRGVIGVVANSTQEIELAVSHKLQCIELRADLLLDNGLSVADLMAGVEKTKNLGLACLMTLRHPSQGGKFAGSEAERVSINRQALESGADIIDLEWGTDAANIMLEEQAPIILSYHDFNRMPDNTELAELTERMLGQQPAAIKVVPTAAEPNDALRMLQWVKNAENHDVKRIGFAMGPAGTSSRILATAAGSPVTYTSFGEAIAPGQIALNELLNTYGVMTINQQTTVIAITGSQTFCNQMVRSLNQEFQTSGTNQVAVGFIEQTPQSLDPYKDALKITSIKSE